MKSLVVFDFDHTVVDDNTDTHVMKLGKDGRIPEWVESKYQKGHWTAFMNSVFEYLFKDCAVSKNQYEGNLSEIPLTSGFLDVFEYIRSNIDMDCIIVSDSNSWFIDVVLSKHKIDDIPSKIFTNPGGFVDGCLKISPHHSHSHDSCPVNLCKGEVLQQFLEAEREVGIEYGHVFYVGDGGNDFCPSKCLKENDILFARKGYRLHEKLEKLSDKGSTGILAKICIWQNGMEILTNLEKHVNQTLS